MRSLGAAKDIRPSIVAVGEARESSDRWSMCVVISMRIRRVVPIRTRRSHVLSMSDAMSAGGRSGANR